MYLGDWPGSVQKIYIIAEWEARQLVVVQGMSNLS